MKLSPLSLSLRQLQYAVAVADTLSFRAAAERCHVAQPSLSAQLAQLEDALGVRLFERDRRRVLPTTAGRDLVERALKHYRFSVGYALRIVAATCRSAGASGELRRHTSPIVRCGAGSANARTRSPPRAASVGTASFGKSVTPAPPATICVSVERLVARNSPSRTRAREHTATT